MAQTPSARRREGRNAFDIQVSRKERDLLNPYLPVRHPIHAHKAHDWDNGWKEAEAEYRAKEYPRTDHLCPHCGQEL